MSNNNSTISNVVAPKPKAKSNAKPQPDPPSNKVQFVMANDQIDKGNGKPLPAKYVSAKMSKDGYVYTHHVDESDDGKDFRNKSSRESLRKEELSKVYYDPYDTNKYRARLLTEHEIGDFGRAVSDKILRNPNFITNSKYSSVSKDNYLHPEIDHWNQSSYREPDLNKLYFSKIEKNESKTVDENDSYSRIMAKISTDVENVIKQHPFVREVLIHFLPKLQINPTKPMKYSKFIRLAKMAGLYPDNKDSKTECRSGIEYKDHKTHFAITITYRFCEVQTEIVIKAKEKAESKSMTEKDELTNKRVEELNKATDLISNLNPNINKGHIDLNKISAKELDGFLEDYLRFTITIHTIDNGYQGMLFYRKLPGIDKTKLTLDTFESSMMVRIHECLFIMIT